MTCREKLAMEYPAYVSSVYEGGCKGCPSDYGYQTNYSCNNYCKGCWNQEIIEEDSESKKTAEIGKHVVEGIKDAMFISDICRVLINTDRIWSISYDPSTKSYDIYIQEKEE